MNSFFSLYKEAPGDLGLTDLTQKNSMATYSPTELLQCVTRNSNWKSLLVSVFNGAGEYLLQSFAAKSRGCLLFCSLSKTKVEKKKTQQIKRHSQTVQNIKQLCANICERNVLDACLLISVHLRDYRKKKNWDYVHA